MLEQCYTDSAEYPHRPLVETTGASVIFKCTARAGPKNSVTNSNALAHYTGPADLLTAYIMSGRNTLGGIGKVHCFQRAARGAVKTGGTVVTVFRATC